MQIISLEKSNLHTFNSEFLALYPYRKLLIIKLSSELNLDDLSAIEKSLIDHQVQHLYSLPESTFAQHPLFLNRQVLGLTTLLIAQSLDLPTNGGVSEKVYRDTPHLTGASERLHEYGWRYPDISFLSEIILTKESLNFIGPFAKYYFERERPANKFLLLNPADLDFKWAQQVKEQLNYIRMYVLKKSGVYFSPDHPRARNWHALSENALRGPRIVDIDVANTCTHNCNFCGLYNDLIVEKHLADGQNGKFQAPIEKQYQAKIETHLALKLIEQLPHQVEHLTFGGLGDPFTHPDIIELIEASLARGFKTTVYSNYAYMSDDKLARMHKLCSANPFSLHFIVNLSAAHAATYARVRPNQGERTFKRVIDHLKKSTEMRSQDGRGITFTLMSVTNASNYQDMPDLVARALETNALALWIKPMEIHGEHTLGHLISESQAQDYAYHAKVTLALADHFNVELRERDTLEAMAQKYDQNTPPETLVQRWLDHSSLFKELTVRRVQSIHELYQTRDYPDLTKTLETRQKEIKVSSIKRADITDADKLGVSTAGHKSSLYDSLDCHIALEYVRIEVDGKVLPCCISNHALAQLEGQSFFDIWMNGAFEAFRTKLARMSTEKFHRHDPQWFFCEQCVHTDINKEFHLFAGRKLEVKD